jgi:hypothetical protein
MCDQSDKDNDYTTVGEHIQSSRKVGSFQLHEDLTDVEDYAIVYSKTRDSDGITNANFRLIVEQLEEKNADYSIQSFNHWGVGWYENISVHPKSLHLIQDALDHIEDNIILDEEQVGQCDQCNEHFDVHDSAHGSFCGSFCESDFYKKPCKECGWSFDIRDIDEKKDEEGEYTCEDCL